MDKLYTILATFPPETHKAFRHFVQRQRPNQARKDLALLDLLSGETALSSQEIQQQLYPIEANPPAYHALRKRLMRQLIDFVFIRRVERDPTTASHIMSLLAMATYLLGKQLDRLGWEFLRKAERMAQKHEQHSLLNTVYNLQLEHADSEFAGELDQIIDKLLWYKKLADEDERARMAHSVINHKLAAVRARGKDLNFHETVQTVLQQFGLNEAMDKRPQLAYKLLFMTRSAVLAQKDFYAFEPYLTHWYKQLQAQGFSRQHHASRLRLLYLLAHVLYRNKKFAQSMEYLDEMEEAMQDFKGSHYGRFYPKHVMLSAANKIFLGQIHAGIDDLEHFLAQQHYPIRERDRLNALFSLGLYHFLAGDHKASIRCGIEMQYSDHKLEKKMGREWVIKKLICEAILQYKLDNAEYAMQRIETIESKYSKLMRQAEYKRLPIYLNFLKRLINASQPNQEQLAYEDLRSAFSFRPMGQEDIQEVAFYAWLKSQLTEAPFYPVLQELVYRATQSPA